MSATAAGLVLVGTTIVDTIATMDEASTKAANYKSEAKAMRINAQQERYAAEMAYQEGSLSSSMARLKGRDSISSGVAAMSAMGNIGTSAQSAIREGAFNLDKDLAAIRYKYYNEAIQHKNQANIYDYNAKIMERNAKDAKISGYLGVASSIGSSAIWGYQKGIIGG